MTLTEHNALTRVPSTQNDIENQATTPDSNNDTNNYASNIEPCYPTEFSEKDDFKTDTEIKVLGTVCLTFVVWAPSKKVGVKQHSWATGRTLLE